jgi:hypothetical protein
LSHSRSPTSSPPKVTFDISESGDGVKLTVIHNGFKPGSAVLATVSDGWPLILSKLKTLLGVGDLESAPH